MPPHIVERLLPEDGDSRGRLLKQLRNELAKNDANFYKFSGVNLIRKKIKDDCEGRLLMDTNCGSWNLKGSS